MGASAASEVTRGVIARRDASFPAAVDERTAGDEALGVQPVSGGVARALAGAGLDALETGAGAFLKKPKRVGWPWDEDEGAALGGMARREGTKRGDALLAPSHDRIAVRRVPPPARDEPNKVLYRLLGPGRPPLPGSARPERWSSDRERARAARATRGGEITHRAGSSDPDALRAR